MSLACPQLRVGNIGGMGRTIPRKMASVTWSNFIEEYEVLIRQLQNGAIPLLSKIQDRGRPHKIRRLCYQLIKASRPYRRIRFVGLGNPSLIRK